MMPSANTVGSIVKENVFLDYFDAGGNLLIFGDTDASTITRKLANQFGLDFFEIGHRIY